MITLIINKWDDGESQEEILNAPACHCLEREVKNDKLATVKINSVII